MKKSVLAVVLTAVTRMSLSPTGGEVLENTAHLQASAAEALSHQNGCFSPDPPFGPASVGASRPITLTDRCRGELRRTVVLYAAFASSTTASSSNGGFHLNVRCPVVHLHCSTTNRSSLRFSRA